MQKIHNILLFLVLSISPALAQDQDVLVIPDNTRFDARFIPERRVSDPTISSLGRGRIWFDENSQTWKGDTGLAIITFSSSNAGAHKLLSATHSDTVTTSPVTGDIIRYLGGTSRWTNFPIGTANQLLGVNSTATDLLYRSILGTTNQIVVTQNPTNITFSLPQNINTGANPTFATLTLTGNPPLVVSGNSLVTNLNADLLDSQTGSFYQNASNINAGLLGLARGGLNTNISAGGALGDILCANAATTFSRIAGQITTTRKFFRQTGDGANSACPAWDTFVAGDIPNLDFAKITTGIVPVIQGGFGADNSAQTRGKIPFISSTGVFSFLAVGTTGQLLTTNGASADPTWSNETILVVKTADETVNNSTTLQDDNHLFFPLAINTSYRFYCLLLLNAASATPDFRFGWTFPSSATMFWGPQGVGSGSNTVDPTYWIAGNAGNGSDILLIQTDTIPVGSATGTNGVTFEGIVRNANNAGNLQLQWAQDTANASNSLVLKDSHCLFRKLQ